MRQYEGPSPPPNSSEEQYLQAQLWIERTSENHCGGSCGVSGLCGFAFLRTLTLSGFRVKLLGGLFAMAPFAGLHEKVDRSGYAGGFLFGLIYFLKLRFRSR